jgi:hypothetical protein
LYGPCNIHIYRSILWIPWAHSWAHMRWTWAMHITCTYMARHIHVRGHVVQGALCASPPQTGGERCIRYQRQQQQQLSCMRRLSGCWLLAVFYQRELRRGRSTLLPLQTLSPMWKQRTAAPRFSLLLPGRWISLALQRVRWHLHTASALGIWCFLGVTEAAVSHRWPCVG